MSCASHRSDLPIEAPPPDAESQLRDFHRHWLSAAHIAPPNVPPSPPSLRAGDLDISIRLLRPEDASWNQWGGPGFRLFNNRAALCFELEVNGTGELLWLPEETSLEVNRPDDLVRAASNPDELLFPLLRAAIAEARWIGPGELVARTRAAGPFREAYLATSPVQAPRTAVIAFPLELADQHIVALRLRLGVRIDGIPRQLTWVLR